jgi:hypothetical protein
VSFEIVAGVRAEGGPGASGGGGALGLNTRAALVVIDRPLAYSPAWSPILSTGV